MSISNAIEVTGLSKVYGRGGSQEVRALDSIDLSVPKGSVVGLLGPNGAGKTTAIKCICTLIRPDTGAISVGGVDVLRKPEAALQQIAAVLEGNRNLHWDLTVKQNLEYYGALQGFSRRELAGIIDDLLARFELTSKRNEEAGRLSRGMQQKLALAAALVRQTPVLLLDEPTLGLDVDSSHEIRAHLKELAGSGHTILLSSHDMHVVQDLCESVIVISKGRIVAHDRIASLLGLFRTRAFRITGEEPVSDSQMDMVRSTFSMVSTDREGVMDVQVPDADSFYVLADALRSARIRVEKMESLDPDLEQVYLNLMKRGVSAGEPARMA